jgi:nucleoside-diphosphate-sugar epimerase
LRICCIAALYLILYDTNPMVPDHLVEVARNLTFIKGADQKLDFTYIEDAARGTAMLYQAKALKHNVYNIATGVPTSVGRVAELCREYS